MQKCCKISINNFCGRFKERNREKTRKCRHRAQEMSRANGSMLTTSTTTSENPTKLYRQVQCYDTYKLSLLRNI